VIERVGPDGRHPFYLALDLGIIMAAIRKELSDVESFNDSP
jgi:hypothetical protein